MNVKALIDDLNNEKYREVSPNILKIHTEVYGFSSPYIMQLLSIAVKHMSDSETYLEVGTFRGRTLLGAMIDNKDKYGVGIDNFSEFCGPDEADKREREIDERIAKYDFNLGRVRFFRMDYKNFIPVDPVGVYFYDGNHDTNKGLRALEFMVPYLADKAIIVIDDISGSGVWKSIVRFCHKHIEETSILFCMGTQNFPNPSQAWWNGIMVLLFNRTPKQRLVTIIE